MLIVPPQHMELINSYIHCGSVAAGRGELDRDAYDKPWQWLVQNQGMHVMLARVVIVYTEKLHEMSCIPGIELIFSEHFHSVAYGLDAVPNEGISCDNESLQLEFSALISTCSSVGIHLEKFNKYVVYIFG